MSLVDIYERLVRRYGPQHWWPAQTPFEVAVGAILTQSTAWTNVEKGIANLREAGALSPGALRNLSLAEIAVLVHPCGYYNSKAKKLKAFADWLGCECGTALADMFRFATPGLRRKLLTVYGIGEETADSILLYAGNRYSFVIDAYTRRIVDRLGLKPRGVTYADYRNLFMQHLPRKIRTYNEMHALFVRLGKEVCRKTNPRCDECCLAELCRSAPSCKKGL